MQLKLLETERKVYNLQEQKISEIRDSQDVYYQYVRMQELLESFYIWHGN